jgi:hypothetical protein
MAHAGLAEGFHEFAGALANQSLVYDVQGRSEFLRQIGNVAASDFQMTFAIYFACTMQEHIVFPFGEFSGLRSSLTLSGSFAL